VILVLGDALRRGIDELLAMIGGRLAQLQVTFGLAGENDLSRGLGGAGDAAQAVVQAWRATGIVAAHDHRPDDEVMGGAPEVFDALAPVACPLNPQPPLGKRQIPVTPAVLEPSPRHEPPSGDGTDRMIQKRAAVSRRELQAERLPAPAVRGASGIKSLMVNSFWHEPAKVAQWRGDAPYHTGRRDVVASCGSSAMLGTSDGDSASSASAQKSLQ